MKNPCKQLLVSAATAAAFVSALPTAQAVDVTSNFNVTVALTAVCRISTAPGAVAFTYAAFGAAANASTPYAVECTNGLGYTMALDTPVGGETVGGLNYSLSLSAAGGTGSGAPQPYTVNGTMAGGQAGDTTASATQGRVLTITY